METLNKLVVASLPFVPLPVVRRLASRYIAGETLEDAVRTVRAVQAEGACATLDVLGEDVQTKEQAIASREQSVATLRAIARERIDSNLSIKLTSLGLKLDPAFCLENVRALLEVADELGIFVRFDMEDSSVTTATLELFQALHRDFSRTGVVLQAYLRRTEADLRALLPTLHNFRLVKGIYRESAEIAFQGREEIQQSFVRLLEQMLAGGCYVGIATHDEVLVQAAERSLRAHGLNRDQYEFQMLLGVLPGLRRRLIAAGHRVRVYVPFGPNWYGYSTRRFKENPTVAGYVFRALLRRD
ncbi:MAG: proline dehydrogenase family protein [Deltaproteobacteria bacterium]|nr:proline dehydrogenase family protein [Deltaproteobacteria bacterium]